MTRLLPTSLAAAVLALSMQAAAAAEIYRWVDDEGVTQYGQHPPPDRPAERLEGARGPADDPQDRRREIDKLIESNKAAVYEKQLEREEAEREARRKAERKRFCERLRSKRQRVANSPQIREKTEDGYRVMAYEERQAKVKQFDRELREHCGGG